MTSVGCVLKMNKETFSGEEEETASKISLYSKLQKGHLQEQFVSFHRSSAQKLAVGKSTYVTP